MTIVEPILRGIIYYFGKALVYLFQTISSSFYLNLGPSVTTFYSYFGGQETVKKLFSVILYSSYLLAFAIFIFHLFMCLLGKFGQVKHTPWQLVGRFIATMLVITTTTTIPMFILDQVNIIWEFSESDSHSISYDDASDGVLENLSMDMFNSSFELLGTSDDTSISSWVEKSVDFMSFITPGTSTIISGIEDIYDTVSSIYNNGSDESLGETASSKIIELGYPLFLLILLFCMVYEMVKLLLEIIERYLVTMFAMEIFPLAISTCVATTTSRIFISYLQLFICQCFLILMNGIAIKGLFLFIGANALESMIGGLSLIAYLKLCQRIDSYMKSLGLSVAQTGGSILDSVAGSLALMGNMSKATNMTRNVVGGAVKTAGALAGSAGAYHIGSMIASKPTESAGASYGHIANSKLGLTPTEGSAYSTARDIRAHEGGRGMDVFNTSTPENKLAALNGITGGGISDISRGAAINSESISFGKNGDASFNKSLNTVDGQSLTSSHKLSSIASPDAIRSVSTPEGLMYETAAGNNAIDGVRYSFDGENAAHAVEDATGIALISDGYDDASSFETSNGSTTVFDSADNPLFMQEKSGSRIYPIPSGIDITPDSLETNGTFAHFNTDQIRRDTFSYDSSNKVATFATTDGNYYRVSDRISHRNDKSNINIAAGKKGAVSVKDITREMEKK